MESLLLLTLLLLSLCCEFSSCTNTVTFLDTEDEMDATLQKAQYHFEELHKSVAKISSFQRRSSRTKRDDHQAKGMKKSDFLFNSLLDFCLKIQDFGNTSMGPVSEVESGTRILTRIQPAITTDMTTIQVTDDTEDGNWFIPEVFPLSVHAWREADMIHLLFTVKYSVSTEITRIAGFDIEKKYLDKTDESDEVSKAKVDFTIHISSYCEHGYEIDNQFVFGRKDKTGNNVRLRVDACRYDKFQYDPMEWKSRTRRKMVVEHIKLPRFRIESKISEDIILVPGENVTLNLTIDMDFRSHTLIEATFYDRSAKKMVMNYYALGLGQYISDKESRPIMEVLIMNRTYVTDNQGSEGENRSANINKQVPVKITLNTASGQLTGRLSISSTRGYGTYLNRTIVTRAQLIQQIRIRKPRKLIVFPRRKVIMPKYRRALCNEEGNIDYEKVGRNCTLSCSAFGRDLRDISITKKDGDVSFYRQMSYQMNDRIFLIVDVGEASPAIEGSYLCSVSGTRGHVTTQRLELFTSGFPKIIVNETSVTNMSNETSLMTCKVDGRLPMNISILISSYHDDFGSSNHDEERVDNKNTSVRREQETENGTVLTVELPTDDLRYPALSLACRVSSDLGSDYHSIYLPDSIQNYNPYIPKMIQDESGIHNLGNGTTIVTCAASGGPPLNMYIAIGGLSDYYRIDEEPGHIRVESKTDNGKTLKLVFETKSLIRSTSWLYCVANNEHDRDFIEYYLRDFIDWEDRWP